MLLSEQPTHDRYSTATMIAPQNLDEHSNRITNADPANAKRTTSQRMARVRRVGRIPKQSDGDHSIGVSVGGDSMASSTFGEIASETLRNCFATQTKHDEKWHEMFQKLVQYKKFFNHTRVPQCYDQDPRLGRWVHYQRVEYWLFQAKKKAKINSERIALLETIGFEWDPQSANWECMFRRLQDFEVSLGHCKVRLSPEPGLLNSLSLCNSLSLSL